MAVSTAGHKKAQKLRGALRAAARLPLRVHTGRGSGRNTLQPLPGELPIVILRVRVEGCNGLTAKDKSSLSDPFVAVSYARTRFSTPVAKRTLDPLFPAKDATFDFPIYPSLVGRQGALELIVWGKDVLRKDYLGEAALSLEECFRSGSPKGFDNPNNESFSVNLVSTRASTQATGSIRVKVGFILPQATNHSLNFDEIYDDLVRRSRSADLSLMSAPPTEGIGTIRTHDPLPAYEDDGLSSDEAEVDLEGEGLSDFEFEEPEDLAATLHYKLELTSPQDSQRQTQERRENQQVEEDTTPTPTAIKPPKFTVEPATPEAVSPSPGTITTSSSTPSISAAAPPTQSIPTTPSLPSVPTTLASPKPSKGKFPRVFPRRISPSTSGGSGTPQSPTATVLTASIAAGQSPVCTPTTSIPPESRPTTPGGTRVVPKFPKRWKRKKSDYNFIAANDILGIVMLEIHSATDLPKIRNLTRIGWDMDPFVVVSFGKKVFRTRVIRHSLNPVWDEKLVFQVRRYESTFKVQLTVLDWDKLTSNDHVASATFDVADLLKRAPAKDDETGLYPPDVAKSGDTQEFRLPLQTEKEMPWEAKHNPILVVRAKYHPYDALRQQFWRQYLKQYDSDDTGCISRLELTSMLDSLGSTLSMQTIDGFFTRFGKRPKEDVLTYNEAIRCLEEEICRPKDERKRVVLDAESAPDTSAPATPMIHLMNGSSEGEEDEGLGNDTSVVMDGSSGQDEALRISFENMDFSGPPVHPTAVRHGYSEDASQTQLSQASQAAYPTEPNQVPVPGIVQQVIDSASTRIPVGYNATTTAQQQQQQHEQQILLQAHFNRQISTSSMDMDDSNGSSDEVFERVINIKNCPLCHKPRINSRAEMDIVTHLAVCASQDWARVDRIVVGNFVTASQAQRKWYTRIISKISSGDYRLGANSANIIVQNRMTGQLEEEKMQVYVRLGIRLLYKGAKSRMEGARARRLLRSLSIKQGNKYDSPESARDIPAFIQFHKIKVEEILDPIDSFKTFNQFFYRKLKTEARPIEDPEDSMRLISAADCRMMAFESVSEATRLWIKGRDFSVARLLGPAYKEQAEKYIGGALAIFRLAPQDYHRFHSPVDGTIGPMTYIQGEYYTVNPQAIRTTLDVYGENARKIVPIDSPQFGRVMAVCVGAMMVGSIITTLSEGEQVKRGQEFGYFAFGGSTIVVLFEKGAVEWDEDLLINGRASLETLVRVGMGVGRARRLNGSRPHSRSRSPHVSPATTQSSSSSQVAQ